MRPTPEQQTAIETFDRTLVVEAGAGTGKTWVLVQRFLYLLKSHPDWSIESILAITFTEKAAREMRTRLRQEIEKLAYKAPQNSLWRTHRLYLDRMNVSTIHSLCARILRENAIAAGIDPLFQVLDEQETDLLKEAAIRATIQSLDEEDHPALELLTSLRIFDLRGEMESMLSKRGTLVRLFAELETSADHLARWQAGLEEMRQGLWIEQQRAEPLLIEALEALPAVEISDPDDRLAAAVVAAQEGCQYFSQGDLAGAANLFLQIDLRGGKADNWGGKEVLGELKQALKVLRTAAQVLSNAGALQELGPADELAAEHLQLWKQLWERLEQSYAEIKDAQQALDFDDLELHTERLLRQVPRSRRLQDFLEGIHHLMVDEFQDVNLIQQRIIENLAPLDQGGKLFVVGDAKQSIYRFRQAQVSIFNRVSAQVASITGQQPVGLSTSFRTHAGLVQAANQLFAEILSSQGESYAPFEARSGPLQAHRDTHPELAQPVEMLLLPVKNALEEKIYMEDARIWEAQWLARRLLELKDSQFKVWDKQRGIYRPFEFRDAAVLFRATTQLPLYEAEFKAAGLPYLTVSGRGYYDRPEVQDLISLLAALANPSDDLNLAAALRSPLFTFSDETLYRLRWHLPEGKRSDQQIPLQIALAQPPVNDQSEYVARAHTILTELWGLTNRVDVWTILRRALDLTGYEAALAKFDGQTGRQRSNIQKFLALARDRGEINLSVFLRRLRDLKAREAREGEALGREPESGAVQLMSIHASKGLEFPVVVLADMGRQNRSNFGASYLLHDPAFGLVNKVRDELGDWVKPAGYAWGEWLNNRMETAERKRLLYVACTRAADLLILSGQVGKADSWLTETLDVWGIPAEGPEEECCYFDGYAIQVYRPTEQPESAEHAAESYPENPGLNELPLLALPLPTQMQPQSIAVSRLEQLLAPETGAAEQIRPAIWSQERSMKAARAPGYLVGNVVHRALAHWECLEYPQNEIFELLETTACREGVFSGYLSDTVKRSYQMLMSLRKHEIYVEIQQAQQRYAELPFSMRTQFGTLHGVIDLLLQDRRGDWQLIDWKTEWTSSAEIQKASQQHLTQLAAYAQAVQKNLRVHATVSLCFLSPNVHLIRFTNNDLENAWDELTANLD